MPFLVLTGASPRVIPLGDESISIGRDGENVLVLSMPDVSRRHCRVEAIQGGLHRIVDLGSRNGTFLNGDPVTSKALEYEDRIFVGGEVLAYVERSEEANEVIRRNGGTGLFNGRLRESDPEDVTDLGMTDCWKREPQAEPHESTRTQRTSRAHVKDLLPHLSLIGQNISSQGDLATLLDTILLEVLQFTGYEQAALLLYDENTGRLEPVIQLGQAAGPSSEPEVPLSLASVESALLESRGGVDGDSSKLRLKSEEHTPSDQGSLPDRGLVLSLNAAAPLPVGGDRRRRRRRTAKPLGAICLTEPHEDQGTLDEEELRLVEAMTAQAAFVLQNAQLHQKATTDPLTRLGNRAYLEDHFEEELLRAAELCEPLALIILDLDHFKEVNDRHGHDVGDEVLARAAQRSARALRIDDLACRWGGEEFLFVLPGEAEAGAAIVADRIARSISSRPFGEAQVWLTASMGIALFPDHGTRQSELIQRADRALYAAKAAGRNRVVVFDPASHPDPNSPSGTA